MGVSNVLEAQAPGEGTTRYNYAPKSRNMPLGAARGVYPGRVVWVHDPRAAHWSGNRESVSDQWWMDSSTDQTRVDEMLSLALRKLTGSATDEKAWNVIFSHYNEQARGLRSTTHRKGEIVAIKVNLNNSKPVVPTNMMNVSPQVTLAMVRQLVNHAHVSVEDILVYDAQRNIYPGLLDKIWREYRDIQFVQRDTPDPEHQMHPDYEAIRKSRGGEMARRDKLLLRSLQCCAVRSDAGDRCDLPSQSCLGQSSFLSIRKGRGRR
jgi:hypothetical protein